MLNPHPATAHDWQQRPRLYVVAESPKRLPWWSVSEWVLAVLIAVAVGVATNSAAAVTGYLAGSLVLLLVRPWVVRRTGSG